MHVHVKRIVLSLLMLAGISFCAKAQSDNTDAQSLFNTARKFISSGDYSNAVIVLNQAIRKDPSNIDYREELALAYYLRKDYDQASQVIDPLIKKDMAGTRAYQIAGSIAQAKKDTKEAQKIFEKGLKKFPNSGQLYNDMGLLYFSQEKYEPALRSWIKGIQMEPGFAGNYYNAARTYYYSNDKVWAILYGEMFINMEGFTLRSAEIKGILLDAYKKLFDDPAMLSGNLPDLDGKSDKRDDDQAGFRKAFLQVLAKESGVIAKGITPETLIMLRTRFILDWYNFYALNYPFALFDYERELLQEGYFEAYNQWLFGPAASQATYKTWMGVHQKELNEFLNYHRHHPFQPRNGEYYNDGKISFDKSLQAR